MNLKFSIVLLLMLGTYACSAEPVALKLGPATQPVPTTLPQQTVQALTATPWILHEPRDIMGRGNDVTLTFHVNDNHLTVDRMVRSKLQFGAKDNGSPKTEIALPCEIHGPILTIDHVQQTFVILPGKLVLGAVVPLGNNKWYCVLQGIGPTAREVDQEMLLGFNNDPVTNKTGDGMMQEYLGGGDMIETPIKYKIGLDNAPDDRWISIESAKSGDSEFKGPLINFSPDGVCGWINQLDYSNSQTYTAVIDRK